MVATRDARSNRIDLNAVTFIDTAGKALLWAMHREGAALVASGGMTRAIVEAIEKISHQQSHDRLRDREIMEPDWLQLSEEDSCRVAS